MFARLGSMFKRKPGAAPKPAVQKPPSAPKPKKTDDAADDLPVSKNAGGGGGGIMGNALVLGALVGLPLIGGLFGGGGGGGDGAAAAGRVPAGGANGSMGPLANVAPAKLYMVSGSSCVSSVSMFCVIVLVILMA